MNHKNTKPMDYQTKLNLPVSLAMNYQYGMQNSIISLNVPIKDMVNDFKLTETDIKLKLKSSFIISNASSSFLASNSYT